MIEYAVDNTFAIGVTIFLLWKDTFVNSKLIKSLNETSQTLVLINEKLK